jgi:poly(hydroxyalkanoate) granule-associated protein
MPMTKKSEGTDTSPEGERRPLLGLVHKVLLAAIGAVALAQEELEEFVNKLVERGEIAEKDGKALIRDMRERRQQQAAEAQKRMDGQIEVILQRLNLPTQGDIEQVSAKIAELDARLDELNT